MTLSGWIKQYRRRQKISMQSLADACGFSKGYISMLERGINPTTNKPISPTLQTLQKIAKATGIEANALLALLGETGQGKGEADGELAACEKLPAKKVPLLGIIAAGVPIMAIEDTDNHVFYAGRHGQSVDFALRIQGDSMINAGIYDDDIAFIHQQPEVGNGEIAAVLIDGNATLKRVYCQKDSLTLVAENPKYEPMVFDKSNSGSARILGKLVAVIHEY